MLALAPRGLSVSPSHFLITPESLQQLLRFYICVSISQPCEASWQIMEDPLCLRFLSFSFFNTTVFFFSIKEVTLKHVCCLNVPLVGRCEITHQKPKRNDRKSNYWQVSWMVKKEKRLCFDGNNYRKISGTLGICPFNLLTTAAAFRSQPARLILSNRKTCFTCGCAGVTASMEARWERPEILQRPQISARYSREAQSQMTDMQIIAFIYEGWNSSGGCSPGEGGGD